jgi:hypothetical protein
LRLLDASNKKLIFSPETEIGKVFIAEDDSIASGDEQPDLSCSSSNPGIPMMAEEVSAAAAAAVSLGSGYYPIVAETAVAAMAETAEDLLPVYTEALFDSPPASMMAVGEVGEGAEDGPETERGSLAAVPEADAEAEAVLVEAAEMQEVGVEGVSEEEPAVVVEGRALTYPEAGPSSPLVGRGLAEEMSSELLASVSSQEREDEGPSFSVSMSAEEEEEEEEMEEEEEEGEGVPGGDADGDQ